MKTKEILLIACLALFLYDANCANIPKNVPTNIKEYELLGILGEGYSAKVEKARIKQTGDIVAIKIIDETKLTPDDLLGLSNEAKIMRMIEHPNIIKLLKDFEDIKEKKRYLVMEFASVGNVKEYLKNGAMNETEAHDKFGQIIDAVVYLHGENIVHIDLKPENLLINEDGVIKLADFGYAIEVNPGELINEEKFPGTPEYMPPEVLLKKSYDGPMADVWSLGIVLYELLTTKQAFNPNGKLPIDGVMHKIIYDSFSDPPGVSSGCKAFIRKFIIKDPKKRCVLKDVKKDEKNWLNAKTIH